MFRYEIGDIVWVGKLEKEEAGNEHHWYVVVGDDGNIVPLDYLGMLISSNENKNKENSNFKYNEPVDIETRGGFNVKGHVKCDTVYDVPEKYISYKIARLDDKDMNILMNAYDKYLKEQESK